MELYPFGLIQLREMVGDLQLPSCTLKFSNVTLSLTAPLLVAGAFSAVPLMVNEPARMARTWMYLFFGATDLFTKGNFTGFHNEKSVQ